MKVVAKTANGADKYWELFHRLRHAKYPIERGSRDNLSYFWSSDMKLNIVRQALWTMQ